MGTWSTAVFGNDFAQDWAEDLQESHDLYFIADTLDNALSAGEAGQLEAPFGAEALAAVETLARLEGRAGLQDEDSEAVDEWVAAVQPKFKLRTDLHEKALRVLELVLSGRSELRELWQDSEHYEAWRADVEALRARMQA
ncbi:DUF4259 domain-containing protein [Massilia endophytica]|uniref:DUF4259 domain-containing protein n=1 Tax=Massilia endophytica TaxID=2899220 RepID=UPI001E3CB92B|nr:DUF4259 domain-containing protein [Massilia endophytica]UGQ48843.1 DUF4259 domain-containing protein [Massilia endophytica]